MEEGWHWLQVQQKGNQEKRQCLYVQLKYTRKVELVESFIYDVVAGNRIEIVKTLRSNELTYVDDIATKLLP